MNFSCRICLFWSKTSGLKAGGLSIQKLHLNSIYLSELLNFLNKPLFWVWPTSYYVCCTLVHKTLYLYSVGNLSKFDPAHRMGYFWILPILTEKYPPTPALKIYSHLVSLNWLSPLIMVRFEKFKNWHVAGNKPFSGRPEAFKPILDGRTGFILNTAVYTIPRHFGG